MREAFELGRAALLLEGIPEDQTPELLTREGVDAAGLVLIPPPVAAMPGAETPAAKGPRERLGIPARLTLVRELSGLDTADWATLVAAIPGAGSHVSRHGTVAEQVAELVRWAESPTGPGLATVEEAVEELRRPLDGPSPPPGKAVGQPMKRLLGGAVVATLTLLCAALTMMFGRERPGGKQPTVTNALGGPAGTKPIEAEKAEPKPLKAPSPREADLELVSFDVVPDGTNAKVDVKLRNIGDRVAFVKQVDLIIENYSTAEDHGHYAAEVRPVLYDWIITDDQLSKKYSSFPISRKIDSNDVDFIEFTLGYEALKHKLSASAKLRIPLQQGPVDHDAHRLVRDQ